MKLRPAGSHLCSSVGRTCPTTTPAEKKAELKAGGRWHLCNIIGSPSVSVPKAGYHPGCHVYLSWQVSCSKTSLSCVSVLLLLFSGSVMSDSCDPVDRSPPGSPVHGVLQARTLEWVAIPFCRDSSWPRDGTHVSCIGRWVLYHRATGEASWVSMTFI